VAEASYYARRSARDPAWREAQIAGAMERERIRREQDPEGLRAAQRERTRRTRERQRASGLTFADLLSNSPRPDPATLRLILREEVALGRIEYLASSRRYHLNGKLPADVRRALLELQPPT
jgi:hypothetical protein